MYAQGPAPGMRGPRTRFTSLRSPLMRRPLGGSKTRIAAVIAVSLVSCAACGQSKVQHESSASPSHSPLTLGRQATPVVPVNAHGSAGHSMSRLIIVGATGSLGSPVLRRLALSAGHEVSVVVRTPSRLPLEAQRRVAMHRADLSAEDPSRWEPITSPADRLRSG